MMISVFVGTSVDGFIARRNDDLDFLPEGTTPTPRALRYFASFAQRNPLEKERYVERKARKVPQSSQSTAKLAKRFLHGRDREQDNK